MGTIDSIADRFRTDIEVVTGTHAQTGVWNRSESTIGGGAMTCVASDKRQIRVFHDHDTHGSHIISVDGQNEFRLERRSRSAMYVAFMKKDGAVYHERTIELELDAPVRIEDPSGRPMVLRRFRHPDCLLDDIWARVHA